MFDQSSEADEELYFELERGMGVRVWWKKRFLRPTRDMAFNGEGGGGGSGLLLLTLGLGFEFEAGCDSKVFGIFPFSIFSPSLSNLW